jgi:protein TonB
VDVSPPPTPNAVSTTTVAPPPQADVRITPPAPPAPPAPAVQARAARINANDPACKPEYPAAATRAGATGISRIKFSVDAAGKVTNAEVVGSSGPTREHRLLDKTAQAALSLCPFSPGVDATGKPVGTEVVVEYAWKLE